MATWWTARLAWADYLSRDRDLAARQTAVGLFPSATLYERLAQKREELGGDSIPDLKQAVALEPENADRRIRLGLRAELAGDFVLAERSLLEASRLSRLYQPRYLLAQYYFRRQNADHFHEWAAEAFAIAYGDIAPLLELCWHMQPDAAWLARQAHPSRPQIASQILLFLARHQQANASVPLALRLAGAARPEDLPPLLEYCNQSLHDGDAASAAAVWNSLYRRRLLADRVSDPALGVSLTNGDFEHTPVENGFDWRLQRAPWLNITLFPGGMRTTFSGSQPERCLVAWQYVLVMPEVRYCLRLLASPSSEVPATDVLDLMLYDSSERSVPMARSAEGSRTFIAPAEILRLQLLYQRPIGSTRLNGTIAIRGVRLEKAP